jgi:hypothetical protein
MLLIGEVALFFVRFPNPVAPWLMASGCSLVSVLMSFYRIKIFLGHLVPDIFRLEVLIAICWHFPLRFLLRF